MTPITAARSAAVVFLLSYFGAMFVPSLPEGSDSDERVASLLSGSDQTLIIVGGYLLVIAGIAALLFAWALSRVLGATRSPAATLVGAAGTAYAALVLVAAVMFVTIPLATAVGELTGDAPVEAFRIFTQAGFVTVLVPALLCALVMIVAASLAVRAAGVTPRWVAAVGFVVAPVLLLGFAWVPQFLVPLWAVITAFGVRPRPADRAAGVPQGSTATSKLTSDVS